MKPSPVKVTESPGLPDFGSTETFTSPGVTDPQASIRAPALPMLIRAASDAWASPTLNADTSRLSMTGVASAKVLGTQVVVT